MTEINEDPDLKEDFDAQRLKAMELLGQFRLPKLMNPYNVMAVPFVCTSVASAALIFFETVLPSSPSGERNPFQFLECDVRGGDVDQIKGADAVNAWVQSMVCV